MNAISVTPSNRNPRPAPESCFRVSADGSPSWNRQLRSPCAPDPAQSPRALCFVALAFFLALAGCQSTNQPAPPRTLTNRPAVAPNMNTDPCAGRLHDICGSLLLFYATHNRLPEKLEDLKKIPGPEIELSCPVSQQPYRYFPSGFKSPDGRGRIIIYDTTAPHDGFRWGISIIEPDGMGPLVTKVIAVPPSSLVQPIEPPEQE